MGSWVDKTAFAKFFGRGKRLEWPRKILKKRALKIGYRIGLAKYLYSSFTENAMPNTRIRKVRSELMGWPLILIWAVSEKWVRKWISLTSLESLMLRTIR